MFYESAGKIFQQTLEANFSLIIQLATAAKIRLQQFSVQP